MFAYLADVFPPAALLLLWQGTKVTIYLTVLAGSFGLILGIMSALGRMSDSRILNAIAGAYIEFFRGTPLLVQLFIIYFALPALPVLPTIPAFWSGVIGLSLYAGAYNAEIVRGAFNAVSPGQKEASRVLGLSSNQTMRFILIPQAMRIAVPGLGNRFISLIKDSTLASVITVDELLLAGRNITSITFQPLPVYFGVAFIFLILSNLAAVGVGLIERYYDRPYRGAR